jgi:hypothetical protein
MEALRNYIEYHLTRVRELPPSKDREVLISKLTMGLEAYQETFKRTGGMLYKDIEKTSVMV